MFQFNPGFKMTLAMIAMPTVHGEERDMFSAAFKNSLTERRHAVRVAAGVEQMEQAEGP